ncbi:MAG: hypothetical protein AB7S81_08365 [Bdellovibrionales bacterium]
MVGCEEECLLGGMSKEEQEALLIKIADKGGQKALQNIGLKTPEDAATFREALNFVKSYKAARQAARLATWELLKSACQKAKDISAKVLAVVLLFWIFKTIAPESLQEIVMKQLK